MKGKRLIHALQLKNLLSYGSLGKPILLEALNILIGPNASGKSNLLEAISLLKETPSSVGAVIRERGGIDEWLWKGDRDSAAAEITAIVDYPEGMMPLRYRLAFTMVGQRFEIVDEAVENELPTHPEETDVYFFYRYQNGLPVLNVRENIEKLAGTDQGRKKRHLKRQEINPEKTVLAQRNDPDQYPEITYLGSEFSQIRIYKDWNFNAAFAPRIPQRADAQADFLYEDARNLALVLNNLWRKPQTKRLILEKFKKFYASAKDIAIITQGGTVQIYVHEEGLDDSIPATRLSDGTLRYLCLLTILCHPTPPPLLCIEEPELGMHPDILPTIAELLIDASHRTQLIVTTHSDALVSALTEFPESILVCEHDSAGTRLNRLDPERLKGWLEKYSLGQLWQMGEIGGTRW